MRLFTREKRWLLSVAVALSMLCLVGCGGGEENPADGGGEGGGGNNVIGNNNCTSGATCKQMTIGTQVWMAENLNIATSSGSWCYGGSSSYCGKYGRLYDWETAMTVCPAGWHLPSRTEWGDLAKAAGGTGTYGGGGTAGTKLKSTSGWNSSGNGTDDYGFSALPGGYRNTGGGFGNVGGYGSWWTATEATEATEGWSGGAYGRGMDDDLDDVREYNVVKSYGYSVRCLRD